MSNTLYTGIWREEPMPDNPFATQKAFCHGFNVYGQMLGKASWVDMLFLLFWGDAPTPHQAGLLEDLAVALANAGPRDQAVQAAMASSTGGAPAAAALMSALAVGAGRRDGARDVFDLMTLWASSGTSLESWLGAIEDFSSKHIEIWPDRERPAGFDPHGRSTPLIVLQTLGRLGMHEHTPRLRFLIKHRPELEAAAGMPLTMAAVAAAALSDIGFMPDQGEMLHLLLRLPGAAAHALEQRRRGFKNFPFPPIHLEDDPDAPAAVAA